MVSLNVNADAKAKVQGSEDAERYPIVAEVKGPGKDGGLKVEVGIESPISAKVSGDRESPLAVAVDVPELQQIASSLSKMAETVRVEVGGKEDAPLKVALGRIPVDLTFSVISPKDESVLTVSIKGSIGD
jgi:hypothetical protein